MLPIAIDDELTVGIAGQFQVVGERVTGIVAMVAQISVAIALARFALTCVEIVSIGRITIEADPLDLDVAWVAFVVARIGRARIVNHGGLPPATSVTVKYLLSVEALAIVRERFRGENAGT